MASRLSHWDRAEYYAARASAEDRHGTYTRHTRNQGRATIQLDPPDAEFHLFRFDLHSSRVEGGEPRLVPVAARSTADEIAGRWCLRVVQGADGVEADDLILAIGGHSLHRTVLVLSRPRDPRAEHSSPRSTARS